MQALLSCMTLHNYPLVAGLDSFISHLNSLGSIRPDSHKFWRTWQITHTSLLNPTRYTHFYSWIERVHMWVKALPKSTASTANAAQPAIEPAISRLHVAHATTEPRRPTSVDHCLRQRIRS